VVKLYELTLQHFKCGGAIATFALPNLRNW